MSPRTAYFLGALIGLLLGITVVLRVLTKIEGFYAHRPMSQSLALT